MPATSRAGLYLCPPPAVRPRESRVRAFVRPPLRAVSRALLRLADFTMRLGLALVVGLSLGFTAPLSAAAAENEVAARGVCERDAEKVIGQKPVRLGGDVKGPRRISNAFPPYPELPPGTVGQGAWRGEILIDSYGKVARVWTLREVTFTPALPEFNKSIIDAIQQWQYEPLLIEGTPMAFCTTVSMSINWQR